MIKQLDTFNDWTVIGEAPIIKFNSLKYWLCRCICGTEKEVSQYNLTSARSTGCGCKKRPPVKDSTKKLLADQAKGRPAPRAKGSFTVSNETKRMISAALLKSHAAKREAKGAK